ncbi:MULTISPECIES: site-2 protease family protein [Thermoactinomyces]|uniref:site-2 protease family protein n=1 Tax=Thermoactinomyces TaxID=2023 RepID=UPI00051A312B|nr:site-2 protease family protein [Thermoactinomyces daqus]
MDQENPKKKNRFVSWLGWIGVVLMSLLGKLKALLPLLKFGKFGGTLISMLVSIGGYALFFPIRIAVGLVLMIFIHEMGHVLAAKQRGLPVSAPAFIPFLGALITMKKQPSDAETEAFIALGGPLLGTVGAFACYCLGIWWHNPILLAIAYIGFFINLFNLLPIHPLDGGRIVIAVTRWLWVAGLVFGLVLIIYLKSLLLVFIYILFVLELWSHLRRGKRRRKEKDVYMQANVERSRFEQSGIWIPGEAHRRSLPYRQYCTVETQEHFAEVEFPGIGTILRFICPGEVTGAELVSTSSPSPHHPDVRMVIRVKMIQDPVGGLQSDDEYYRVPAKIRWLYGIAYFGLALFLVFMMIQLSRSGLLVPGQVS